MYLGGNAAHQRIRRVAVRQQRTDAEQDLRTCSLSNIAASGTDVSDPVPHGSDLCIGSLSSSNAIDKPSCFRDSVSDLVPSKSTLWDPERIH